MSAAYHQIGEQKWKVTISHHQQRMRVTIDGPEWRAQAYVDQVEEREQLEGLNMVEVIRAERAAKQAAAQKAAAKAVAGFPASLRKSLDEWLARQEMAGDLRSSTVLQGPPALRTSRVDRSRDLSSLARDRRSWERLALAVRVLCGAGRLGDLPLPSRSLCSWRGGSNLVGPGTVACPH